MVRKSKKAYPDYQQSGKAMAKMLQHAKRLKKSDTDLDSFVYGMQLYSKIIFEMESKELHEEILSLPTYKKWWKRWSGRSDYTQGILRGTDLLVIGKDNPGFVKTS